MQMVTNVQVMGFWGKAERVVAYKRRSLSDARKKELLDKQLSFLVDQTSRYSSILAQRLKDGTAPAGAPCFACLPAASLKPKFRKAGLSAEGTVLHDAH